MADRILEILSENSILARGRHINSRPGTSRPSKSERFIDENFAEMPKVFKGVRDNEEKISEY